LWRTPNEPHPLAPLTRAFATQVKREMSRNCLYFQTLGETRQDNIIPPNVVDGIVLEEAD
jgi:hypothetical protein